MATDINELDATRRGIQTREEKLDRLLDARSYPLDWDKYIASICSADKRGLEEEMVFRM